MKQYIKSLPHHPKRVIVISLIIALVIGVFGYIKINKKPDNLLIQNNATLSTDSSSVNNLTLGFLTGGRIESVSVKAGDTVKAGQVLATLDEEGATGALTQAQAAYSIAKANYDKIINGATGTAIDVAKAAVNSAQVNLDGITKQQSLFVASAYSNLLNSTIVAKSTTNSSLASPSITGTYNKNTEGTITLSFGLAEGSDGYFTVSGIAKGTGIVNTNIPEPILDTGLYIQLPQSSSFNAYSGTTWEINIPNNTAPDYLANYNAYQSALQNENQAVSNAQATLDQANASLTALVSAARPEDVVTAQAQMDNAQGAVQIAQAALNNTIIIAPTDGTIVSVYITPGQIAMSNAPAIEFISN